MATKPGYTTTLAVSDAAETQITASTYCAAILLTESPTASGFPRQFLFRAPGIGSTQIACNQGAVYRMDGPFQPGDLAGKIELVSAGGDSSTFNVIESPK